MVFPRKKANIYSIFPRKSLIQLRKLLIGQLKHYCMDEKKKKKGYGNLFKENLSKFQNGC